VDAVTCSQSLVPIIGPFAVQCLTIYNNTNYSIHVKAKKRMVNYGVRGGLMVSALDPGATDYGRLRELVKISEENKDFEQILVDSKIPTSGSGFRKINSVLLGYFHTAVTCKNSKVMNAKFSHKKLCNRYSEY